MAVVKSQRVLSEVTATLTTNQQEIHGQFQTYRWKFQGGLTQAQLSQVMHARPDAL